MRRAVGTDARRVDVGLRRFGASRERRPQFHSASAGMGRTRNQCSSVASAARVPRKVKPAAWKSCPGRQGPVEKQRGQHVAAVTAKGNSRFIGAPRKKLPR